MRRSLLLVLFITSCWFIDAQPINKEKRNEKSISIAGIWNFKLDPMNVSIPVKGSNFASKFPETITLPGSTDQAGKGYKTQDMTSLRLTRLFEYSGAAWYEKENIFIPEDWKDKQLFLFLERAHWETQLWVNGKKVGRAESLSAPHTYDITPYIKAGDMNTVRIRVDNGPIYNIAYTHAVSAETQTNWNGIIGRMEIQAYDKVHIADLQVYPKRKENRLHISAEISNPAGQPVKGEVHIICHSVNTPEKQLMPEVIIPFEGNDSVITLNHQYDPGVQLYTWDEFDPYLYKLEYGITIPDKGYYDGKEVKFGIRDLATRGTQFTVNDISTFMRGAVNSCEFPLTGYPPMDYDEWKRVLTIYKEYGMNCIRFHSWCPPEAAFIAADELGLYFQVENPDWRFTVGEDEATNQFYFAEAQRIFKEYGNHPSFAFFCEGNELVGKGVVPFLQKMLKQWKTDPRHLYVAASGYPTVEGSDFYEFYGARPQRWQEGLKGRFNAQPLNTLYDYSDYVSKFTIPMITHEIGQWCVYPDFDQVSKYVGVLKPYNYELFREDLRNKKMLDQAHDFHIASGKFQVIQKKEEFESYFRTPGFGGYHLLQLQDFPGQGTSPVGVVDAFYDPKPYVTAEEFRNIQNPCMPLLRVEKFTWTNAETFTAKVQVTNFLKKEFEDAVVSWTFRYPDGRMYAKGSFSGISIPIGRVTDVGEISLSLADIKEATDLIVHIKIEDTDISNEWKTWIYPLILPEVTPQNILIVRQWDRKAKAHLARGGNVLLLADTAKVKSDVPPGFSGISWNAVWSGTPPNTLGILCDPDHAIFKHFPTEFHSNWQWFDLVRNSKPMVLDHTPYAFRPLLQIIPDWNNNRKIGLIFEAKVGKGKLLATSIAFDEIMKKSPVARQMYYSMVHYLNSDEFSPKEQLTVEMIDKLFDSGVLSQ